MKPATALVSLIAALAPLASACSEAPPVADIPAEAMILGDLQGPSISAAARPAAVPVNASSNNAYVFPRQASPFGKSYEEWSVEWYHWALGVPKSENPMLGSPCGVDQSGEVFFLAGTTGGSSVRSCTIPVGKAIFLPIVNLVTWNCPEYANESYTCDLSMSEDFLQSCLTSVLDGAEIALTLEIDGVPIGGLEEYHAASGAFLDETSPADWDDRVWPHCTGPIRENSCGVPVGSTRGAAAEGYWTMLRPLSPGEHQVRFTANVVYASGRTFALDVEYNITVAP
jgi:hypothetical protein